ncbi:type VI secretion system ATPase TssH [Vibrio tapetis subsp. quintayensis]|uniref:type VI secretion system ATPase TssH n=1 Tax=Vibrio tapetis TaxID=52443 RepID=UPI0025B5A226|nr:type VI secretion system ATPase TssH [Vibrio tapetis]MDN3681087.1 type VI secretion system ATPase TssH [Vibrio tapetis subsp. quintayensis]
MTSLSLTALVERLTPEARSSLEQAAALASSRSHHSIEMSHWLLSIIKQQSDTLKLLAGHFDLNLAQLEVDVQHSLEKMKTGCQSVPGLSGHTVSLLKGAWIASSIEFSDNNIDTVHLIYAVINDDTLFAVSNVFGDELAKLSADGLKLFWQSENRAHSSEQISPPLSTQALDQFTVDLTEQARQGRIDPVVGRDSEIRLMIDILMRRRQNNPILTGEAGVGKTAVVEGLALKVVADDVPPALNGVAIRSLDLALLQAGAGMKGEFENRLKSVIKEVNESPTPIIMFIDEAHGLIGSGGQAGQGDTANILKPALARGELRTIAATTWAEYKKYVEKDAALTRRFQVVQIEEPTPDLAIEMLRGLVPVLEKHHGVHITNEALKAAVSLSGRYIQGRQLPDKAVSVLDTACSRVALSQASTPGQLDIQQRVQQQRKAQISQLEKEQALGGNHESTIKQLTEETQILEKEIASLNETWQKEKQLVEESNQLKDSVLNGKQPDARLRLVELEATLAENVTPMVFSYVNEALVSEIVSDWTGIPLGKLQNNEIKSLLSLKEKLCERVIGQDHALDTMSQVIITARAQLNEERKPNGIFFLTGPSGVGKTESALAIAEQVYGSEDNVTVINMSEFKEEHKVSLLLGSPPGYVGYGEGGVLTEAVRRKPYSVILLDEMEKAHPGVQDIFYQVFDKGSIKDGEGRDIDFRNTIIIMTSNVGTDTTMALYQDPQLAPDVDGLKEALRDDLLDAFKPAFLGRVNVIPYLPLDRELLKTIAEIQLNKISNRLIEHYQAEFLYSENLIENLVNQCNEDGSGARAIQTIIQNSLLPKISSSVLESVFNDTLVNCITVDNNENVISINVE